MKNEHDLTEMTRKAYPDGFPECEQPKRKAVKVGRSKDSIIHEGYFSYLSREIKIIKYDRFRSAGRGVNQDDDMVRVTVEMTAMEFKRFQRDVMPKVEPRNG